MSGPKPYKPSAPRPRPTKKQQVIINLVCLGMSNKEIGLKLQIAENTVKFHLTRIFSDLHVNSRTQLVLKVMGVDP